MGFEKGIYRSDVEGHLFDIKLNPTRVTCLVCMETCNCDLPLRELALAVSRFTVAHGFVDAKVADSILQLIPPSASEPTK